MTFKDALLHGMTIRESATDGSDFTNPDADYRRLFLGEDGVLHVKDSSGTVTDPVPASSGIAATIFDAKGDIIVASAADTAVRLAAGTDYQHLVARAAATNGVEWQGSTWTDYTPTWTTSGTAPAIVNGSISGRWKALDSKTYVIIIRFSAGSSTTYGTGTWSFSLPAGLTSGSGVQLMVGHIEDSGTDNKLATGQVFTGSTKVDQIVAEGANVVTNTVPQTWASGDKLHLQGILEIA